MNVVGVTSYGNDFCFAVLKRQDKLDPQFVAEVKNTRGWETIDDQDELLDSQTFVAWYRSFNPKASIKDALNNESFAWQGLSLWTGE